MNICRSSPSGLLRKEEIMLIDSETLKKAYCDFCNASDTDMAECPGECITHQIIDAQPTVEAATVRHAHWIERGGIYACSNCDAEDGVMTKFCSSCGYQMDGGAENGSD